MLVEHCFKTWQNDVEIKLKFSLFAFKVILL